MKNVGCYYQGFGESDRRIDYLRGLSNEFGPNLEKDNKNIYNEDKIIKKVCNHRD